MNFLECFDVCWQVRYSAPPKTDEEGGASARRVTRGRQVHYFDHLMMTEDEEEEEMEVMASALYSVFFFGLVQRENVDLKKMGIWFGEPFLNKRLECIKKKKKSLNLQ